MSDTSTRSGMLWEVERILKELKETDSLPQVLLMENVPQVHGADNVPDFNKWQLELSELGYKNYWEDLIATDYGIPQTRNRCFMVSILGDYNYSFPKPIKLEKKLKDMLEDNVDEKYYISDDLLEHIIKTKEEHQEYTQYDRYNGEFEQLCRVWKQKSPTLHTKSNDIKIYVKNATKKGYLEATGGTVQKGKTQTLTTSCDIGVVNKDLRIRKLTPKECFRLMGVKDEDYEKCAKNQSDSSLYHLAGDSIVVNVLMAIFKEML
jgi:DNA (cytosine-5)-methyltransferase 1